MNHSMLKDVTLESHQWTVRVRAIRFSEYLSNEQPRKTLRIDLILLDEEGKAMEGQIPQRWIHLFEPLIKEGSVYYIKYFQVCDARFSYRPIDHPYMMKFTAHTKVTEVTTVSPNFPKYAYNLASYEVLRTRIGETKYCSDAIGVFTGCTHVRIQNTRAGQKKLRNIQLTDGRETIGVALWNDHAEAFDAALYMEMGTQAPVVLLFVATTCSQFEGKLSLQGSTLCKWYANPEIPEATALQARCAGRIDPPMWHGPGAAQLNPERITVAKLAQFDNPHIIYNNRYIIVAKIKKVVNNQSWWYVACEKCNRAAQAEGDKYKCSNPKCLSTSATPRYRVPVIVSDPNPATDKEKEPTVELVFFGTVAEEIIGVPADVLINAEGGTGIFLPTRITELYGRQFELRVSVSKASLQRTEITYQVDNIIGTADAPLPLPSTTNIGLPQQMQQDTDHDKIAASSMPEATTDTMTKDAGADKIGMDDLALAQHTPAISEKRKLKRKVSEIEQGEPASGLCDSETTDTANVRRRLLPDDSP